MPKKTFVCENCGSDNVLKDAYAAWDADKQVWVLASVHDNVTCEDCGDDNATLIEAEITDNETPSAPAVHITTPFADVEVPINDLGILQRNALAELLGLRSAKAAAFKKLSELKPFQKIKKSELQAKCPHKVRIETMKVELTPTDREPEGKAAVKLIWEIMPEAECSPMMHTMSMYCKDCAKEYSLSKHSVLVRTVVAGVPFNKLYEV